MPYGRNDCAFVRVRKEPSYGIAVRGFKFMQRADLRHRRDLRRVEVIQWIDGVAVMHDAVVEMRTC